MRTTLRFTRFTIATVLGFALGCSAREVAHTWGYDGPEGPEHWAALPDASAAARTGTSQSPIDIAPDTVVRDTLPGLRFAYADDATLEVGNNGHTVEAAIAVGTSAITIGTGTYDLAQFHFHVPSEHTVAGKHFPAELHLVHRSSSGALAVVGVFLVEGAPHAQLAKLYAKGELPLPNTPKRLADRFNLTSLLPPTRATYRYDGSLTTPPCTEGVAWIVFQEPLAVGPEQLAGLVRRFQGEHFPNGNRRPTQPLGTRVVRTEE